ncbi:G-protein coupled receptor Mth2-like [Orussus abietinus]|uniref:G-protein coupled receptor Mth2-like n=1 Tax=Orussus abietinus TaxID=222816 RepID=UPI00062650C1|nr:G-protein coupled receptor Mth2-like [Orussus abietinus]
MHRLVGLLLVYLTGMVHTAEIIPVPLNGSKILPSHRDLPLVGKCCPVGEILTRGRDGKPICLPFSKTNSSAIRSFSPLFGDFNQTGVVAPGEQRELFVAIIGDPCKFQRYMLAPEESSMDQYYLLLNGSIFAPSHVPKMLHPGVDYCMEVVPKMGIRVLVCFPEEGEPVNDSRIIFYACGLLISVPFLILTIVAYSITPRLRDVYGKALCHYCGCLAVAFTSLAIAQLGSGHISDSFCVSIAFVIQFSFVACFFWLNVMCVETWLLVRRHVRRDSSARMHPRRLFFYYSIWAWTPPALLILVSMAMDLSPTVPTTYVKPNFGEQSCWFKSDMEAMPYFYVPVGFLVLGNFVLFTLTAVKIASYQRDLDLRRLARNQESDREEQRLFRRLKRTFFMCLGLFFLMGINWAMELISWWAGGDALAWSAFDMVNALQGVLVFGLFVLRKPVRDLIWYRIQVIRGINVVEPDIESMDLRLLPVATDSLPRQRLER